MLEKINEEFLMAGYVSHIRKIDNKNCIYVCKKKDINSVFFIYENQKKILLMYNLGQIPVEKEFATIESLLDFVKEVFPIEQ